MGQLPASCLLPALLWLLTEALGGPSVPTRSPLRRLLLALVLHAPHLVPVRVFLQVALAAAARAEAEGQVVALLGPHVLPALLLVPGARSADAVELDQDRALPLVETLQVHPVAIRAELVVAQHPLVVVLPQVDGSTQAAAQRGRALTLCMSTNKKERQLKKYCKYFSYKVKNTEEELSRGQSSIVLMNCLITFNKLGTPGKISKAAVVSF